MDTVLVVTVSTLQTAPSMCLNSLLEGLISGLRWQLSPNAYSALISTVWAAMERISASRCGRLDEVNICLLGNRLRPPNLFHIGHQIAINQWELWVHSTS